MDLIDRAAALEALGEKPFNWNDTPEEQAAIREYNSAYNAIACLPAVEAVPLDKLCEWLSEYRVNIPCETCRNCSNGYCMAIGDVNKPCPNEAEDWQRVIKEWMEGLDDHR